MPERKRRPAAKRTPAKKAPAKKTAAAVEESVPDDAVTDDAVTDEVEEGTPAAEEASGDEAVEATDEVETEGAGEAEEAAAEESDEPEGEADEDDGEDDESDRSEDSEAVTDDPDDPADPAEPAEEADDEDAAVEDEPADDTSADEVDADEPDEPAAEEPAEADRAEEPEEPEEEPAPLVGRARLFDAITHFRRGQVAVAVLLCVLGYAAVVQVQTNTEDSTYAGLREQELIDILSGLAGTSQKAQEQIEELEATRDELEDQTLQQQTALQRAEEQVDTLRVIAGTVPVSGPGITIEIDPGADPLRLTALLDLIEELRTSGAEAMEIEGADGEAVRLVASSSIEVSQPASGLNVSGELISPPYRLKVIGPPDTLAGAIDFYQGPQDQLEEQGAEVKVESEEKIDIESIHTVSR
jgi:uncharacterized protein YlxW (UPF0749 family)